MRKSDIAYVPNPSSPTYVPPLEEMDLRTLTKNFLCGKSHGLVSVCKQCESKCAYGQRALDLLSGKASSSPDLFVPYDQTILARMKAEKEEKKEENSSKKKVARNRQDDGNWYQEAMAAEHPYEWVAEHFGIPVNKARKKVYQYRYAHKDKCAEQRIEEKHEEPETAYEPTNVQTEPPRKAYADLETKLDELMRQQEEYKKLADEYTRKYQDAKEKADLLARAMDILEGGG